LNPTDELLQQKLDHVDHIESLEAFLLVVNAIIEDGALSSAEHRAWVERANIVASKFRTVAPRPDVS
jgi:hypothetical protein